MKRFCIAAVLSPVLLIADVTPRVVYSKYFKGSVPEYAIVSVERDGRGVYKESANDELPLSFQLPPSQTAEIFELADKLDHFKRPLESPAKVANMGIKTFRYEEGTAASEVKFNYSEDVSARMLADWFERIVETEQNLIALERAVKFDKLGVNQALVQIQITLDKKRLVAPDQFLPLLDRVVKNESFMHMSRERAASLAEAFRNPALATESK